MFRSKHSFVWKFPWWLALALKPWFWVGCGNFLCLLFSWFEWFWKCRLFLNWIHAAHMLWYFASIYVITDFSTKPNYFCCHQIHSHCRLASAFQQKCHLPSHQFSRNVHQIIVYSFDFLQNLLNWHYQVHAAYGQ